MPTADDNRYECFFYVAGNGISGGTAVRSSTGHRVGYLNYGNNWVICQAVGEEASHGAFHNHWWAWTEANNKQWGWVNALYAHGGANDGKFGGVPGCTSAEGSPPHPAPPPPETYAALGDSYSSGVGTRDYDLDNGSCKRSSKAYAPLVASAEHFRLTAFPACSGATTQDVLRKQMGALAHHPTVVTISVGGDDAGFSTVVWNCLVERWKCASSVHSAENFMRSTGRCASTRCIRRSAPVILAPRVSWSGTHGCSRAPARTR